MSVEAGFKIRYDANANAAYIYVAAEGTLAGNIAKTYLCDTREINGMINLDFDDDGRLLGVEIMDARSKLPHEVLKRLEG
jgi:uncharacterized protein YuzE